jgi:hypothetical protein
LYPLTCNCDLQEDKIHDVIEHTVKWIPKVTNQYDEPKFYEIFQDVENLNKIIYFMTFSSKKNKKWAA